MTTYDYADADALNAVTAGFPLAVGEQVSAIRNPDGTYTLSVPDEHLAVVDAAIAAAGAAA